MLGLVGNGRASTMKRAKLRAARDLLHKLEGTGPASQDDQVKPPIIRSCYSQAVCILHNFCAQRNLPPPSYHTPLAPGAIGGRYKTICRCGPLSATGTGDSRKLARREAAEGIITQIRGRYGVAIP